MALPYEIASPRLASPRLASPRLARPPACSLARSLRVLVSHRVPPFPHRAAKKAAAAKAEEEAAAKKAAKKAGGGGGGGGGGEAGKKRKREEEPSSDAAKASSSSASGSRVLASGRVKKEVAIEAVLSKAQYVDLRWNPLAALEAVGDPIQRSAEYKELPGFRGVFVGVGDVVLGELKDKRPLEPRPS